MLHASKALLVLGLLGLAGGCAHDYPHPYGERRPDMDTVNPDDRGLGSKDLVNSTDLAVRDLLSAPAIRNSAAQWILVVDRVEDRTLGRQFNTNYDIFLERMRTAIGKYGQGAVTLVENRQRLGDLRNRELDNGAAPAGRMQPQFALYAKAFDMPNRATNTYMLSFIVTDMRDGRQVWTHEYSVTTAR